MNARVTIAYPAYKMVDVPAVISIAGVMGHMYQQGVGNGIISLSQPLIDWARNQIVENALGATPVPTHLMWVDSDIVMPSDTVSRLLAHNQDIVGGIYVRRTQPHEPMIFDLDPEFKIGIPVDESIPLQPVDGFGMGCMLVKFSVYQRMAEHFGDHVWHRATWPEYGEDVWFFRRVKEMGGIQPYLDTNLRCHHITTTYASYQSAIHEPEPDLSLIAND